MVNYDHHTAHELLEFFVLYLQVYIPINERFLISLTF